MLEYLELLHIYACLFGKCEILTLALPATWLVGVKDEEMAVWLKEQFPMVDRAIKLRYIAFGQKYLLYGSDSFIGHRIRNGEDTCEPEFEIEAPEDHEVPPTDDGLLSKDADHERVTTGSRLGTSRKPTPVAWLLHVARRRLCRVPTTKLKTASRALSQMTTQSHYPLSTSRARPATWLLSSPLYTRSITQTMATLTRSPTCASTSSSTASTSPA
jgi:hypothetical protein